MKKQLTTILVAFALLLTSCALVPSNDSPINGTWKLSTVGGFPLSYISMLSDTIVISKATTFSETGVYSNGTQATIPGTVTSKGSNVYSLAYIDGSHRWDYELATDGTTLSSGRDNVLVWVFKK